MNYVVVIILIVFSALFSGLTLGLMSLNVAELKRKSSLGDKDAAKVYQVRKRGNLLLTTLLVGNVAVNATLSLYLGSLAPGLIAGLMATVLIVIFGEILPQAVFSRFALSLGVKTVWLVKIFIFIFYPVTAPIAWVLDKALGKELPNLYSKQELIKIIEEHEDIAASDVDADEERIVTGALTFSEKRVRDVMTPRTVMNTLDASRKINKALLDDLRGSSNSRIPIFDGSPDNIVGILYLNQLLGDKNTGKTVGEVASDKVYVVDENKKIDTTLNDFLRLHHHLFIVNSEFGDVVGLITLEDILEEIIRSEIIDEVDKHEDLRKLAREKKRKGQRI